MSYQHHIAHCQALRVKPLTYVQFLKTLDKIGA